VISTTAAASTGVPTAPSPPAAPASRPARASHRRTATAAVTATSALHLGAPEVALLAAAGFVAGAVNAVAGGGSLISFPALLAVGYPSVAANVTNAVAVLPGYVGGSLAYRRELGGQGRRIAALGATSVVGAIVGARLLIATPGQLFERVVPFLILFSCALLAVEPAISRRLAPTSQGRPAHRALGLHAGQLATSVYGGYFGAGLGILLLAVLGLGLRDDLHRLNALKGVLSLIVGAASVAYFALFGPVGWSAAGVMVATSLVGGQVGVTVARRVSPAMLRWMVVAVGVVVSAVLLARA
jgi:uncharacterized membrane protein YfcA